MTEASSERRIVVGVDGSDASSHALRWAAAEAERRGRGLDVVHAWMTAYPLAATEVFADPAPFEAQGRAILERAVTSLGSTDRVSPDVRTALVEEHATKALVRASEGADLLVVGSRGRGGLGGLRLGSVSQHCMHYASCPVAVIPPKWSGEERGRIVVGVDGSEPSYRALHWAISEAAARHAQLDVVNAYDDAHGVMRRGVIGGIDREALEKTSRTMLEEMVGAAVGAAERPARAVELIPAATGATQALLDSARGADLLVVGSRGRGTVSGKLLGSVSNQCVHHASCPVVVVRGCNDTMSRWAIAHITRGTERR